MSTGTSPKAKTIEQPTDGQKAVPDAKEQITVKPKAKTITPAEFTNFQAGISELTTELDNVLHKTIVSNYDLLKAQESMKALKAAEELSLALKKYKDKHVEAIAATESNEDKVAKANKEYVESALSAIYDHKSAILAGPSFWNQLKSRINNFIQKYMSKDIEHPSVAFKSVKPSQIADSKGMRLSHGFLWTQNYKTFVNQKREEELANTERLNSDESRIEDSNTPTPPNGR